MKWYPLAHLAAVKMSCFGAELQALQLLFPNSASGIARASTHSFYTSLNFRTRDVGLSVPFRQLKSFSTMSREKA